MHEVIIDCKYALDIHLHNADHWFGQFLEQILKILDKHAPFKYMAKK